MSTRRSRHEDRYEKLSVDALIRSGARVDLDQMSTFEIRSAIQRILGSRSRSVTNRW